MPEPLKTLFLLEDLCFGGTQKQNLELARRLDRDRFSPQILTLTGHTDLDDVAQEANIPLRHMGKTRKPPPLFFTRLKHYLKEISPDILVPCTALPNIWGRIWGKYLKIPVIVGTCRGGGAPIRQHEWLLWRFSDAIVCNSRALCAKMGAFGAPESHLAYIPNGVDTQLFKPVEKDPQNQLIVCVARLAADKDHRTLLKAFELVAGQFPNARLRLVGEGPEEGTLRDFVRTLPQDVSSRVAFAGASSNPASHYDDAAIFALSSTQEGQPNVILEAMSSGLPVCATAVGGIPSLVEDGASGFLSPAGDAKAMARNFAALLANPALAHELGMKGRAAAEKSFSFAAMVNAHEQLFNKLWQKRQEG